ncbi:MULTISPECIES: hypothetical protein [Bacteroidaceae]|uniref:hypothetical protein n=1 Tax=Bacteroidaceae TaxID=815 RepID=UPI003564B362
MKQKILEALKAKFPGVNANVLNRIADKLCKTVTTDEQVTTAVAGVTKEVIEIIESYGDSRATEAQQTAVQTYEQKYGLKDGVKIDNGGGSQGGQQGGTQTVQTQQTAGGEQVPAWAQALIDSNKTITERLNKMDGDRTTATRKQQLSSIIEKLPENLRKAYERTPVDGLTDEQFNTLVGEITSEVEGIVNDKQAKGAVFGRPSAQHGGSSSQGNELTKEQMDAISHRDNKPADGQPF